MNDFFIKKLNKEELNTLYSFMKPIWEDTYSFLPKEQVDLLLDKYFLPKNIENFLASGYEYYSVNREGVLVVLEQEVGLYVDKLYLLPSARGKNLPKKAFEFLLKRGKKLYLNVNKNNKRAINCYLKNGFKITKEEEILVGNGLINCDYVMEKEVNGIEIKKCSLCDLNELENFYNEVLDYLVQNVNYPKWTPGAYPCRESIQTAISKGYQYGAYKNGILVGAFIFNEETGGDYGAGEWKQPLKEGEFSVIHTLATHQKFYGQGIAKQMVEFCLNYSRVNGYKGVRLDVVPTTIPAIKLYTSLGFTFAGEKDLKRNMEEIPTFCLYEFNF